MKQIITKLTMLALALVGGAQMMWAEETQWVNVWEEDIAKVCTDWVATTTTTNGTVTLTDNGSYKNMTASSGGKSHTFNQNLGIKVGNTAYLMCRYQASRTAQNAGIYYNKDAEYTIAFLNVKEGQRVIIGTTSNTVLTVDNASTDAIEAYTHTYLTNKTITYYKNTYTVTSDGIVEVTIPAWAYVGYAAVQKQYVSGTCEDPKHSISGTAGNSRKFTLSCPTEGATIYYSETEKTVEDDGWIEYKSEVTTNAETVYAYAKTNDATSNVISFATGAGTEIKLNAPVITKTTYSDGNYSVSFSSTQTDLSVVPSAVNYSYSIAGGESKTGSSATVPAGLAITVTTTADGYANSDATTWVSAARPTGLKEIFDEDYTNLTSATGDGAYGVVLSSEVAFSCSDRKFYNITGYNNGGTTVDVDVTKNVGISTSTGFYLRCKGNNSGILQNNKNAYLGITNLIPGQTIVINSSAPLSADYGVTFEDGMSAGNDYYFTATGTTASILVTKGTYNYIKTITVMGEAEVITLPTGYNYSTFCSTSALDFTDNGAVEAYIATADGTTVTLKPVTKVPANTGLILKKIGDATTATVPVAESVDAIGKNDLVAVTTPVTADELVAAGNAYILVSDTQFSKVVYGATGEIPAGKAYLVYNALKGASAMRLYVGEATAAASVEAQAQQAEQAVYTLQGIRVSRPTAKGLYIVDGKVCLFK